MRSRYSNRPKSKQSSNGLSRTLSFPNELRKWQDDIQQASIHTSGKFSTFGKTRRSRRFLSHGVRKLQRRRRLTSVSDGSSIRTPLRFCGYGRTRNKRGTFRMIVSFLFAKTRKRLQNICPGQATGKLTAIGQALFELSSLDAR